MRKVILFILIINIKLCAQTNDVDTISPIKNKYIKYILHPDSHSQARLFSWHFQYLYSPWGKTFKTGGTCLTYGINLARLFSRKFILGLSANLKVNRGFTKQKFSNEFLNDFNNSFITSYLNPSDSIAAYTVKNAINDVGGYGFHGNYYGDIGIIFSPFPQKFGGILLSFKRGYRNYPIFIGPWLDQFFPDIKDVNVGLEMRSNYSFEVAIKPYTFFHNGFKIFGSIERKDIWRFITLSFYIEQLNLKDANFQGVRFDNMVNSNFISKYGVDRRYGIKLGFALY